MQAQQRTNWALARTFASRPPAGGLRRIAFRLFACLAGLLFLLAPASAQISPGPLSRAHQQLEGVASCVSCHNFRVGPRALKCLECHVEIQHRITSGKGFHAKAFKVSADQQDCARCHMEHNGQTFPLIRLDRNTFNHATETGFTLEGKHRLQKCEACHNAKKMPPAVRQEIKMKDPNKSFLGLGRACLSCHEDKHRGQLGPDCARCHTQDGWKPVTGFNHAQTKFPLTGLHQPVACSKCHLPKGPEGAMQFKGLSFSACQNCHNDPHHGAFQEAKFRGGCDSCHTTAGWKKPQTSSGFSHEQTHFPLLGKHTEVVCAKCHKDPDFHRPIPHDRCQKCHEDPHNGQFANREAGSDCAACHNEKSFKPTLFDRVAHQKTAFRLEAKHASLACGKCHQPEGKSAVYVTRMLLCSECHADPHRAEFAAAPANNKCDLCHTQEGFKPATFDLARHAKTRFPLDGKHATVKCVECHKPLAPGGPVVAAKRFLAVSSAPDTQRQYHFSSLACNACHKDPHQTKLSCETCHSTREWKQTTPYDHSKTKFRIEASHQKVACLKCHTAPDPRHVTIPGFADTPLKCAGCHAKEDPHDAQFQKDCSPCHTPSVWKLEAFDHERTRFPLDIAHRNVKCAKCHKEKTPLFGKVSRSYSNTPVECVKCH